MTDKIQKAPEWLEPEYFVLQYVDYAEDFEHTETPFHALGSMFHCLLVTWWSLTTAIGVSKQSKALSAKVIMQSVSTKMKITIKRRTDVCADSVQRSTCRPKAIGEFELKTHAKVDKAYPGTYD